MLTPSRAEIGAWVCLDPLPSRVGTLPALRNVREEFETCSAVMGFDPRIELAGYGNRWEYNDVERRLGDATLAEGLFCLENGLKAVLHAAEARNAKSILCVYICASRLQAQC